MSDVCNGDRTCGDIEKSFNMIYEREIGYVWNCLRRLGVEERDLEDKVHDVFVIFFRRFVDYDATRPARPWLGGIAARVASDHRRTAYKRREILKEDIEDAETALTPEVSALRSDSKNLVMIALDALSHEQREVFVLHDIEGHSMPEIADMISLPLNTLYSRLRLARNKFTSSARSLKMKRG